LVRLESAARARDGEKLCERIYLFAGGPSRDCADSMREHFSTEDGFSVAIRTIRLTRRRSAVATAATVEVDGRGRAQRYPNTTFRLERRDGVWRVVFVN
jgi:hypothetical protein